MDMSLKKTFRTHFLYSLDMLGSFSDICPGDLWHKKKSGYIFWQQILHALEGVTYWFRLRGDSYDPPFGGRKVFPDLTKEPVVQLSKKQIKEYYLSVKKRTDSYFSRLSDTMLQEKCAVDVAHSNLDVILMQIRHIQYHVGHCNAILREGKLPAVKWVE